MLSTVLDKCVGMRMPAAVAIVLMYSSSVFAQAGTVASAQEQTRQQATAAEQSLSAKEKAITPIGANMATGDLRKLNESLNHALDAGLTVSEVKEVLVQLYAYAGFPRSLNALGELMQVLQERKSRGIVDAVGREPTKPVATGSALREKGTANQTRVAGAPVKGPVFEFAPAIDEFLQTHLFGDIFERDNLDWQSRELATVGALAAQRGLEPQLQSHVRASLNVGLSLSQLQQLPGILRQAGDPDAAQRLEAALEKHLRGNARR